MDTKNQERDIRKELLTLVQEGLTFSDCVEVFAALRSQQELYYVNKAKEEKLGLIEIDDSAFVSMPLDHDPEYPEDTGAYVMCWTWVAKGEDEQ